MKSPTAKLTQAIMALESDDFEPSREYVSQLDAKNINQDMDSEEIEAQAQKEGENQETLVIHADAAGGSNDCTFEYSMQNEVENEVLNEKSTQLEQYSDLYQSHQQESSICEEKDKADLFSTLNIPTVCDIEETTETKDSNSILEHDKVQGKHYKIVSEKIEAESLTMAPIEETPSISTIQIEKSKTSHNVPLTDFGRVEEINQRKLYILTKKKSGFRPVVFIFGLLLCVLISIHPSYHQVILQNATRLTNSMKSSLSDISQKLVVSVYPLLHMMNFVPLEEKVARNDIHDERYFSSFSHLLPSCLLDTIGVSPALDADYFEFCMSSTPIEQETTKQVEVTQFFGDNIDQEREEKLIVGFGVLGPITVPRSQIYPPSVAPPNQPQTFETTNDLLGSFHNLNLIMGLFFAFGVCVLFRSWFCRNGTSENNANIITSDNEGESLKEPLQDCTTNVTQLKSQESLSFMQERDVDSYLNSESLAAVSQESQNLINSLTTTLDNDYLESNEFDNYSWSTLSPRQEEHSNSPIDNNHWSLESQCVGPAFGYVSFYFIIVFYYFYYMNFFAVSNKKF